MVWRAEIAEIAQGRYSGKNEATGIRAVKDGRTEAHRISFVHSALAQHGRDRLAERRLIGGV
jgi:hypothetical protein